MWFPLSLLGLFTQLPLLQNPLPDMPNKSVSEFSFKEGADVFSPKDLIQLARPGAGVANEDADLVLVPVSEYSFEEKKNNKSIFIAAIESNVQSLKIPFHKGGEAFWLDSRTVAHVVESEESKVLELYALSVKLDTSTFAALGAPILIGTFLTASATNFRYVSGAGRLIFSDNVYADGSLETVKKQDEDWAGRGNSAFVYDSTYTRHWDTWVGPKKPTLFSVQLHKDSDDKWILGDEFVNVLKDTEHHTPVEPFGGLDNFDVSDTQIVYTAKDPKLPEAWHTRQNIYLVSIRGGETPKELTSGKQGATASPVFNPGGDKVAWLEMKQDGNEADRNKIMIYDLSTDVRFTLTLKWDRSPGSLAFSKGGDHLYLTADDHARVKIFIISVPPTPRQATAEGDQSVHYDTPLELTSSHASSAIQPLSSGRLLFTQSSLTSPNQVFILRGLDHLERDLKNQELVVHRGQPEQITRFTEDALKGKDLVEGEDFWFKSAENDVHGWILKPKGWKVGERKKWPVLLLIHGGPEGAWEDSWSTRWNPNIFAQQGYFVVAINPTGSTGFGQSFTDAIAGDWGGKPFDDLRNGWQHVLKKHPEIDAERAVAAGASWGGYAINWIQGHPEYGFNFKALFCHDGVFDASYNGYSTDELFFFNHEWGGRPWEPKSRALSQKYSPSNFVHKWSTPQLIVHGSKDYRLPDTEGIGAFHALQQLGVPSRLVIFPDENHWVLDHGNSLKWHYEVLRWFDQYVGQKD